MSELRSHNSFSFIIPTYNAALHLERCLKSIRSQAYSQNKIEILIMDGGSSDNTLEIAEKFDCQIFKNPKRLAEYGVQLGVEKANGDFLVIFAADNELIDRDWAEKVAGVFKNQENISAVWGKLASGSGDSALNRYFELIQSDPLNWFINKNLGKYRQQAKNRNKDYFVFDVNPQQPLVWGANGLVYKAEKIRKIWKQSGYLGDNDAFQSMVEQGENGVAYFDTPFVYHHHVAKLSDWVKKWKRNFIQHLADKQETRNMRWVFTKNFKKRLFLWILYSAIPIFSLLHSIYLCLKDKNIFWLYHPIVSFLQLYTYVALAFENQKGKNFLANILFKNKLNLGV